MIHRVIVILTSSATISRPTRFVSHYISDIIETGSVVQRRHFPVFGAHENVFRTIQIYKIVLSISVYCVNSKYNRRPFEKKYGF